MSVTSILMKKDIEERLERLPYLNKVVGIFKGIKLPGLEGLSLYDLLELYITGIVNGALTIRASAIAFNFLTALFPFLLFIIIVIPVIPIEGFQLEFMSFLESVLPPSTSEFFFENIFKDIEKTNRGGLLSSVFLLSIFFMANGVNAIFVGFESSYHEQLSRNFFKQYIFALGIALILAILLFITIAVLGYVQIYIIQEVLWALEYRGYHVDAEQVIWYDIAKYVFFVIMVYIATATLYYFGTKEGRESRFFSVGALFSTILFMLTSFFFGIYIENFSSYNELYGSIGALLILVFYLWINANILLLGYELNVSIKKLRKRK